MDAYAALVRAHEPAARRLAFVLCGSDGDDAVQEAIVKGWYSLDRFRGDAPFRAWLLRIVANEARNRRRSAGRREALALRLVEGRPDGGAAPSPEGAAFDRARSDALVRAMGRLKEDDRLVLAYRYFLDLSEAELAHVLGCRPGTVKSRLHRALGRLRDLLPGDDGLLEAEVSRD